MSNKPEIKFVIENGEIFHAGSGDKQSLIAVCEMLEHYFILMDQSKALEKKLDDFRKVNKMLRRKQIEAQKKVIELEKLLEDVEHEFAVCLGYTGLADKNYHEQKNDELYSANKKLISMCSALLETYPDLLEGVEDIAFIENCREELEKISSK